jgi:predicted Rdx family selenoprotein
LQVPVTLEPGRFGQFEVRVDGRTVLERKGGLIAKLTGKPWPSDADILAAVRGAS